MAPSASPSATPLKRRILVASSSPPDAGSGINAYTNQLCESLRRLGVEVHYYSPPPASTQWLSDHGIRHLAADQHTDPLEAVRTLIRYVSRHEISGAINNDNPYLQSAAPALPCPLITVGHMDRRSIGALACFHHEWSDYIVAISSDMQQTFARKYGVPVTRLPIVYNGVLDPGTADTKIFDPSPDELRVVYAGGFSHNKGSRLVLRAIVEHESMWENVRLDWFGDVPPRVKRTLSRFRFVHVHGRVPRPELHRYLQDSDVFLLPSRKEGCPMALLEAMSFGAIPIVSNGIGAMRWIVTNGMDGYVCDLGSFPRQAAECISFLRTRPEQRSRLRDAVIRRYREGFQSETTARALMDLLDRPSVDRRMQPARFTALRWHRPLRADGRKSPLVDRICIRLGWLRRAGSVATAALADD